MASDTNLMEICLEGNFTRQQKQWSYIISIISTIHFDVNVFDEDLLNG